MNTRTARRVQHGATLFTLLAVAALLTNSYLNGPVGVCFKMAASTGFLVVALAAGARESPYGRAILAALALSWWGDFFLTRESSTGFLLGLAAFLLGHLTFAGAFLIHGVRRSWFVVAAVAACVPAALVLTWLGPTLGEMAWPVYGYIAVISLMAALAIGTQGKGGPRLILIGALLFYLSDLFVARQKFATQSLWNPLIGLPLYYAAQLCLAASIARLRAPHD